MFELQSRKLPPFWKLGSRSGVYKIRVNTIKVLVALLLCAAASAQTWDSSGNGLLKGTYYFREVVWIVGDSSGDLTQAISFYGNISFDGNGNYTLSNSQVLDSNVGQQEPLT